MVYGTLCICVYITHIWPSTSSSWNKMSINSSTTVFDFTNFLLNIHKKNFAIGIVPHLYVIIYCQLDKQKIRNMLQNEGKIA